MIHRPIEPQTLSLGQDCTAILIDEEGAENEVDGRFEYDPSGTNEVTVRLQLPGRELERTIPRSHLSNALYEPAGDAKVHLWPSTLVSGTAVVALEIADNGGAVLAMVPSRDVAIFVALSRAADADLADSRVAPIPQPRQGDAATDS